MKKAVRPVFISTPERKELYRVEDVEFEWESGMAITQWQKSIENLHATFNAGSKTKYQIIDISTKSTHSLGRSLSALKLTIELAPGYKIPIECIYQGSKVFQHGGAYHDLYDANPFFVKKDARLVNSGGLIGFNMKGADFPTEPTNVFYDWLYIMALRENSLLKETIKYQAFTDIAFNPKKSINTQARSLAIVASLALKGELASITFSEFIQKFPVKPVESKNIQMGLF